MHLPDKHETNYTKFNENQPKGLKVAKEDQRLMGLMVNRLDGGQAQWCSWWMEDTLTE